ncbi:hypothetical protein WOLCODRAFT_137458 [Wolfiporia cocos MD-104 SS10]|uniref:Serine/threonine-protein phosphatase 1 regulatory subunit 10 n=1 Tax=Wolfiporia cocos (strain MD-104) TaxID=742152 RepID=A0A2H3JNR2_WOLCO|nr:hypothetical protein WOLCODRAFT_137458 [Wolfiporia cocos MD-104 SS10]
MEYTNAWLPQTITDLTVPSDGQHAASDDWKDPSPSAQAVAGTASVASAVDLNDFGLGEISGPSSSSSSVSTPPASFFAFSQGYPYLSSTPGPYNAVAYGASQWSNSSSLPLSSYSSLNGATSTSSQTQQPFASSASPPPMMIDPALTTMNGSGSPPMQQQYQHQHSPPFLSSQPQQRTQYQYQHQAHQPTLSINPSYVHTTPSHYQQQSPTIQHAVPQPQHQQHQSPQPQQQQQQHQSQPQGTLAPYVLHAPSTSLNGAFPPSSFYVPPLAPAKLPGPTPEQRKASFLSHIRPLLTPTSFTGAGAVAQLVGHIEDYGELDVDAQTRLEILTKMRDNAGNHYFRAWVENEGAMDITREWLKSAFAGKSDNQLVETIMPLLHVVDRLPLTIESLKASKLGKIIVKLVKEPPAPAIKDMASNLERKWRQMLVVSNDSKRMDVDSEDHKGKKRKADPASSKIVPPTKKVAAMTTGTTAKAIAVKKDAKVAPREVKDAKSDTSFFSAPKPKPKLPTFKKAALPPAKKEPDFNVAQPSSVNPFEEALKSMAKGRKDSPAMSTPPPPIVAQITAPTNSAAPGKQKKTVKWAPDGQLEMVKIIERAVYDDDPADGTLSTHNVRDLDRDEGAALHAHLFEEQIEWSEPLMVDIPPDIDAHPRGESSQEKIAQEEREQSALVALYISTAQIPDSPAEPPTQIPEEQVDEGVKIMLTGADVDAIFWSGDAPAALEPPKPSVAELVGQLQADVLMGDASAGRGQTDTKPFGLDPDLMQAVPTLANLNSEQLQQFMQALSQNGLLQQSAPGQPSQGGSDWNSSSSFSDYEQNYYGDNHDRRHQEDGWRERGRGSHRGRGRGRGEGFRNNKRKACSYFAMGRCRYGDQCDFSHEPIF